MHITPFGLKVPISTAVCGSFGEPSVPVTEPYINLYVRIADRCPAACSFCIANGTDNRPFDHAGFEQAFRELYSMAYIKKVALTGGEPTLRTEDLERVVRTVKSIDHRVVVDLNTNGFRLNAVASDVLDLLGSISLSRHHWDDDKNAETFGLSKSFISKQSLSQLGRNLRKVQMRCNLIKGYIDSKERVLTYMKEMAAYGAQDFGFVALMPLNTYCTDNVVTPKDIGLLEPLPGAMPSKHWDSPKGSCYCRNYVIDVLDNGMPVRYYTRHESKPETCVASSVVWDIDCMKLGFGGDHPIWKP